MLYFASNTSTLYSPNLENKNIKNQNLSLNQNLVKDKSQAVSEILGYGVDNEGFFTSDFNEAAGLPKDFRIYAQGLENFVKKFQQTQHFYVSIDIAKSIGSAYDAFSSFVNDTNLGEAFSKQDFESLSQHYATNYWDIFQDTDSLVWKMAGGEKMADLGTDIYDIRHNEISKGAALIAFFAKSPHHRG